MPNRYPAEQRQRVTRMALDRLDEYPSAWATAQALGPKLGCRCGDVAQVGAAGPGRRRERPRSRPVRNWQEIRRLKREVADLREANEILKAASIFFARELDPRHR